MDAERFSVVDGIVLKDTASGTRLIQVGLDNDAHPRFVVDAGGNIFQGNGSQAPSSLAIGTQGPQGATGATGATGLTGPTGVVWRGTYSASATYGVNDGVYNPTDGLSYVCVLGTTGNAPPNTTYWNLFAGANSFDRDRAQGGTSGLWEVFPASTMNNGTFTIVSGTQYWTYFWALKTTVSKMRFTVGTASTTTTHAWTAIHALNGSFEPTTQLAASTDNTSFATTTGSAYNSTNTTNVEFSISALGLVVGQLYAAALLWTGTGSPAVRGRTIDGSTGAGAGWSAFAGTYFAAKHSTTGLSALATGNPVTTAANLATNATGIQMGIAFIP
jgi:hypothetical protein